MSSTGFVNGSTLTDADWFNDTDTVTYQRLTSVSGTNTIVGTSPVSMTAYETGQEFVLIPANTNTGATTVNITPSGSTALGAKNLFSKGAACGGGEVRAGVPVKVFYDGTQFNITSESGATNTNNSAAAGTVGEYISSSVAINAVSLSTGTAADVTSISLTAGDWDVSGWVAFDGGVTTNVTYYVASPSTTSATLPSAVNTQSGVAFGAAGVVPFAVANTYAPIPTSRFSLASTTTVYLVARAGFTNSTMTAGGTLSARRVR